MEVVPYFAGGVVLAAIYMRFAPSDFGKLNFDKEAEGEADASTETINLVEKVEEGERQRVKGENDARVQRLKDFHDKLSPESIQALEELREMTRQPGFKNNLWILGLLYGMMLLVLTAIIVIVIILVVNPELLSHFIANVSNAWSLATGAISDGSVTRSEL
eukprot:GEMP01101834.1.p1 GENE.GEMP01101834.1~~GEMP01101834.1.p1  ORF type:complete len:161 (+),score=22.38 GEMP01101834.1:41-523(+)